MFVRLSHRDRLICLTDFVEMTLLAVFFLLPLPNWFLKVSPPTLFAAVRKFFIPFRTSAIPGAPNSDKLAPTNFAAGTIYLRKNGIAVLPKICAGARISVHVVDQYLYRMESLFLLKQPSCNVF